MQTDDNKNTPYATLTPDLILDAVESVGFHCTGSLLALNSYENRVYQIGIEDAAPLIAKFYRPGRWADASILEEHQFALELLEHEIPVIAPLPTEHGDTLHHFQAFRFALFPRKGGRVLELDNLEQVEWMGRFLGRLHAVGACKSFKHRIRLDIQSYGYDPYRFLVDQHFIPAELMHNFCHTVEAILQSVEQIFQQVEPLASIRLHGDCHAGNVLWNAGGLQIVDLDDCLMGPAIQDIWMLLSGDHAQVKAQLDSILSGYREFYDFDPIQLRLIESFRALRMLHYAAWLARRWHDPAFPLSFPWFNTPRYWQEQLQHLREQAVLLDDALNNET